MDKSEHWLSQCEDAGDGTGDAFVTLPPDFIAQLGLKVGDELNIEVVQGAIVITQKLTQPPRPVDAPVRKGLP
ncbi:AbrB/MazE/SpoVT family DNA-binding domain-containing protein [Pseudomonas alliivorans]|nr:AbrB/MazE/SpoVT family DNA-binding domain-containing protein [Pseudomonas alliivorans]MEE5124820.1 AbrB/MazE/SpoVT family DNA-binding domain-containing protein [Pseudomonas alliivorans]MEE5145474.1 AbrB/MazE/SpoVT family DNA-binding domain-containing protein [Pseudomonas alliivorans]MEE5163031.1 AbrB/MazE/SpoVT family DNA-binding domain-containing protein [Pseudomonas alliivorans]